MPQSECSFYPYGAWITIKQDQLSVVIIVTADSDNVPVATFLGTEGKSTSGHYNNHMLPVPPSKQTASAYDAHVMQTGGEDIGYS